MPWIIDYETVRGQMAERGFRCNYYNSGAFGFSNEEAVAVRGWVGPPDVTIKPQVRPLARAVPPPFEANLSALAARAWQELLPGRVWVMPMSHWHYEMNFGSRDWMPPLLENIELDPGLLVERNNAAAIEFSAAETEHFRHFVTRLLEMLMGSDFMLAFPKWPALCTLHHHKQLWWMTTDTGLIERLDALAGEAASEARTTKSE